MRGNARISSASCLGDPLLLVLLRHLYLCFEKRLSMRYIFEDFGLNPPQSPFIKGGPKGDFDLLAANHLPPTLPEDLLFFQSMNFLRGKPQQSAEDLLIMLAQQGGVAAD